MGRFSNKQRKKNKKRKRDRMSLWKKDKKSNECKQAGCKNTAGKGTLYCGLHKPKIGSAISYTPKAQCHTGNVLVFTTPEGIKVYGGGSSRQGGWWRMEPLPDLAMGPKEIVNKGRTNAPRGWKCESAVDASIPILAIDWPDMSIPADIGKGFWHTLVEDIRDKNIQSISCQCMGGHGRTGVQLSILAHLLLPSELHEWKDTYELVMWVRERMCENEVEGKSQQEYISYVCNLPMGEPLNFHKYGGWSQYSYGSSPTVYSYDDDDKDDDDEYDGWSLFQCISCDHEKWEKNSDDEILCDVCVEASEATGSLNDDIVMVNITDNFYDNVVSCPRCKINTPKHAMSKTENCVACEMELLGIESRQDGTIYCESCKRFRAQEMFDEETRMCVPCTKGIVETVDTIDDDTIDNFDDEEEVEWWDGLP